MVTDCLILLMKSSILMNPNSCIKPKDATTSTTPLASSSSRGKELRDFWKRKKQVGDSSYHSASDTGHSDKAHTEGFLLWLRTQLCRGLGV